MIRVFLDASVLFAAAYSATGASREIIRLSIRGKIRLAVSRFVLEEVRRNLRKKVPESVGDLDRFLSTLDFKMVRPTRYEVELAMEYTAPKDAPIVAAARKAKVDYLVSLDRQHIVGVPEVKEQSKLNIVLPAELLEEMRGQASAE